jgi:PAS domain S-box-containing protein
MTTPTLRRPDRRRSTRPDGPKQRRRTRALVASETKYRRLFEAAKDGILILDARTGRITDVNSFLTDLLGCAAEDVLGKKLWELGPPEDVARSKQAFRTLQNKTYSRHDDLPLETTGGASIAVEVVSNVYRAGEKTVIQCNVRDIRQRKAEQTQLQLQSMALKAAANAVLITDRAGLIEWVNPAFCGLTGYAAAEAIGRNPWELLQSQQGGTELFTPLPETMVPREVHRREIVNRRKDGSVYTEEEAITPVHDANGRIGHFIAVKQDVTDRTRAEADSRQRARLSALGAAVGLSLNASDSLAGALQACAEALVIHLDAALARIWTFDVQESVLELQASAGLYTHLNGPHARILAGQCKVGRIARSRVAHATNAVVDDPDVTDQAWARREGIVAFAGHPMIVDGRVVGVMAIFARHPLTDGVNAALGSIADHVALGIGRRRSVDALAAAEERMRFALQNADVGIWDMDYVTGALQWSETLEAQYGLIPGTFAGTFDAFVQCVHPDDRQLTKQTMEAAMRSGADFSTQHRAVWADGSVRWLRGAGRIQLDAHGTPVRGVGISQDVTERREMEAQDQQARKMEAIGRLAGGVAHDFNNLLGVILVYCELLMADGNAGAPARMDIAEIQKAATSAAALTRQLLEFSRRQIIEPTVLDLDMVIADIRELIGRLIGEDVNVAVVTSVAPPLIYADRGQVEQIVLNLAANARDAMPMGGAMTIATANVDLDQRYAKAHFGVNPGPHVMLTVKDSGLGMPPDVRERVFEPFFTTKEVGKGTGLGLATVHGIVAQSGGSVTVESEIDKGTVFKVYFPRASRATTTADSLSTRRPQPVTETVVLVEDAAGLGEPMRRLLERFGYRTLVAANAAEALVLFEQDPSVDLLLTDVVMPGASGCELARQVAERWPAVKVIYMSGYTDETIAHHGVLDAGMAFLHKPFSADVLERKLRDVLETSS